MPDSSLTKKTLSEAMKKLMRQKAFSKISITDICEECGLNRKSFYYHFKDKYDLVNWIFYVDFITDISVQTYEDEWDLLKAICKLLYKDRAFYKSALKIEGQNNFRDYFIETLTPILAFFVRDLFEAEQEHELFVSFFCDAFLMAVLRWFSEGGSLDKSGELSPEEFVEELRTALYRAAGRLLIQKKET